VLRRITNKHILVFISAYSIDNLYHTTHSRWYHNIY